MQIYRLAPIPGTSYYGPAPVGVGDARVDLGPLHVTADGPDAGKLIAATAVAATAGYLGFQLIEALFAPVPRKAAPRKAVARKRQLQR